MNLKSKLILLPLFIVPVVTVYGQTNKKENQVIATMKSATRYMMDVASYKGGFVWSYLPDYSRSWGELEAKRTMAWIQPPGTPAVGHLMLDAYHATKDEYYYESAKKIANALIWGQLPCGGWNYVFDFAGEESLKNWYATVGKNAWRLEEFQHYYGNATFDDEGTMQAGKFLLRLYIEKYDPAYRQPLEKVIDFVLKSQYPIGGWPQRYPLMYDHPFKGNVDYSSFITLNDGVIPENIDFLINCYNSLGIHSLKEPILRALNLMIVLQQGAPYAGWADQYFVTDLKPAHARTYEPRSVNTGTTARMIMKMIEYYKLTAETKFLSGIPAAIKFLESMKLPDSEVAKWKNRPRSSDYILVPRFINPETGKPLYVHRNGSNAFNGYYYTDQNIEGTIAHYSSAAYINVNDLKKAYQEALSLPIEEIKKNSPLINNEGFEIDKYYYSSRSGKDEKSIDTIIKSLNNSGYWLTPIKQISNVYKEYTDGIDVKSSDKKFAETMVGDQFDTSPYTSEEPVMGISTATYINNMTQLIQYLKK